MQVAKWGNSLAIRLPANVIEALDLKGGDEIEIAIVGPRSFEFSRRQNREQWLERLQARRHRIPYDFKFSGGSAVADEPGSEPMSKQQQFLWIVQTRIIANSINRASLPDADHNRHEIGQLEAGGYMADAIWASERIPLELDAIDAVDDFCGQLFRKPNDPNQDHPDWLRRS